MTYKFTCTKCNQKHLLDIPISEYSPTGHQCPNPDVTENWSEMLKTLQVVLFGNVVAHLEKVIKQNILER